MGLRPHSSNVTITIIIIKFENKNNLYNECEIIQKKSIDFSPAELCNKLANNW